MINKKAVEDYIPKAYIALKVAGVVDEKGEIDNTFKGYIASFGAAIAQSGMLPAISYFSADGQSKGRSKLIISIYMLVTTTDTLPKETLFDYYLNVLNKHDNSELRKLDEKIYNAAIALKLVMNLYKIVKNDKSSKKAGD
jgi:hypothetical protein